MGHDEGARDQSSSGVLFVGFGVTIGSMSWRHVWVLWLWVGCSGGAAPSAPVPPGITLRLEGVTVTEAMTAFATASGEPVVVDPAAARVADCAEVTVLVTAPTASAQVGALLGETLAPHGFELTHGASGWTLRHDGPVPAGCGIREVLAPPLPMAPPPPVVISPAGPDGASDVEVPRALIEDWVADEDAVMSSARIIPHEEDGQTVGLRVFGIRSDSVLDRLGLQNGDVVRSVNDVPLTSPERALEAYSTLRAADTYRVLLTRRGVTYVHTIRVVER